MNDAVNLSNHLSPYCETEICDSDIGLYIHIPFCVKRCHFCAFYLVIQEERRIERFLRALEIELTLYAAQLNGAEQRVSTVYVGGGTPTALSSAQLAHVLTEVASQFSLAKGCEITVEATPESFAPEYLDALREVGVTRLSMGIQTFDQQERIRLGLSSTEEEATALEEAHGLGAAPLVERGAGHEPRANRGENFLPLFPPAGISELNPEAFRLFGSIRASSFR